MYISIVNSDLDGCKSIRALFWITEALGTVKAREDVITCLKCKLSFFSTTSSNTFMAVIMMISVDGCWFIDNSVERLSYTVKLPAMLVSGTADNDDDDDDDCAALGGVNCLQVYNIYCNR